MAVRRRPGIVLAALLAALPAACETKPPTPPPDKLVLVGAEFGDLADWSSDRQGEALLALRRSCERLASLGDDAALGPDGLAGRAGDWRAACAEAATIAADDHDAARAFFERRFVPLAATNNGRAEGLFTGYFEPELRGSLRRDGRYSVPLYGRPADLVSVELGQFRDSLRGQRIAGRVDDGVLRPYATRAEIEAGAISGRATEIVWVDDPIDAFFLHVQGSGRIVLDSGEVLRVGYAAQNGHVYVPIGRELIARGALAREDVSMQSIRAWLLANPAEAERVMNQNPSYVFFRTLDGEGPLGSQGVVLTPGRSLAVDRTHLALGVPIWLDAEDPLDPNARVRRLMVAQDTGGAIRGPVRGDVFWGHGADAAERAGRMRSSGRYWLLLPREVGAARLAGR
ncbi:MAG TPA: MltA domain-containing protein [Alphaproteobacteria bacterium]|nr:MltA domain-containing protein [Alphaproteobacteria bacterium]